MTEIDVNIREMTVEDIEEVRDLWMGIKGFGIRSIDDSREGVERFIKRNPTTSIVAIYNEEIIGSILCGYDGRYACMYHVCVNEKYRKHGVGHKMVQACMEALKKEKVTKINLLAFQKNDVGNHFWKSQGFSVRDDINYYEYALDIDNVTTFIS